MKIRNGFFALLLFVLAAGAASAQTTRTYTLQDGDVLSPASPFMDISGSKTFVNGLIFGRVASTSPATFTLSLAFRDTGLIDATNGIYGGTIMGPHSTFSITQSTGRKSVSTSGTIDEGGTVTYRLLADGRAEIISVVSSGLTVWEGKGKRRTAAANGTLDYGTSTEGQGTIVLNYF